MASAPGSTALGTSSTVNAAVTNGVAIGYGASVAASATGGNANSPSVALGANSIADRPNTVSVGSPGNERTISNVAPGVYGTDAVNVNQLNGVAQTAYAGVASSTALGMIPQLDRDKTFAVGVGFGNYQNNSAIAVGASARIHENINFKLGVGVSGSNVTYGAGASYQW